MLNNSHKRHDSCRLREPPEPSRVFEIPELQWVRNYDLDGIGWRASYTEKRQKCFYAEYQDSRLTAFRISVFVASCFTPDMMESSNKYTHRLTQQVVTVITPAVHLFQHSCF